jgi:lysophospholipase L1-like esterase
VLVGGDSGSGLGLLGRIKGKFIGARQWLWLFGVHIPILADAPCPRTPVNILIESPAAPSSIMYLERYMDMRIASLRRYSTRFFVGLVALLLPFATIAPVGAQSTQSGGDNTSDGRNIIWEGLWAGANLELGSGFGGTRTSSTTPSGAGTSRTSASSGTYAALGDSVAAGVGLPTISDVPSGYQRCGRTAEAYPNIVASRMNLPLNHVACSGATAGDLFTKQRSGSPNLPSQLSTAFASGTPELITITAGANDAHWLQFLQYCYTNDCANGQISPANASTCPITDFTTTSFANCYLAILQLKLITALATIQYRSDNHPPTTVVTGYYNPISTACSTQYPSVTTEEIRWMTAEVDALNQTIRQVVELYSFARFAPVDFTGHDVCSSSSWIQGLGARQPFHPTVRGQQEIASSVLNALGR